MARAAPSEAGYAQRVSTTRQGAGEWSLQEVLRVCGFRGSCGHVGLGRIYTYSIKIQSVHSYSSDFTND